MIDLETKYLPDVLVRDEATREAAMLLAPTTYYHRELLPSFAELDADGVWRVARRWAGEVEGVGDFLVLMHVCGHLVSFDSGHIGEADAFIRRLAAGPMSHPSYLRVVERDLPGCLGAASRSWRQVGAWVLFALGDTDPGMFVGGDQTADAASMSARELEREVVRRARAASDERAFIDYLALLASAFDQPGSFVENRSVRNYVWGLVPAMTPTYPRGLSSGESYARLSWSHLGMWLGMATRMD